MTSFEPLVPHAMIYHSEGAYDPTLLNLLCDYGFSCDTYKESQKFLMKAPRLRPNLCFIAIHLKNPEDSFLLLSELKHKSGLENTILIAILEDSNDLLLSKALAAGAQETLVKPVTAKSLIEMILPYVSTPTLKDIAKKLHITPRILKTPAVVTLAPEITASPTISENPPEPTLPAPTPTTPIVEERPEPVDKSSMPEVVRWVFDKVAPVLHVVGESLEDLSSSEEQLKFYTRHLAPLKDEFMRMVRVMRRGDKSEPDFTQSMRLYGISALRQFVVAKNLLETTGTPLRWNPQTAMPTVELKTHIPFAVKTVEHYDESGPYRYIGFCAGLVLDILSALSSTAKERKPAIKNQIEASHREILKKADAGIKVAKTMQDLALAQHILTALTMREAGRITMAIIYPDYQSLRGRFDKKQVPLLFQQIYEEQRYGVSSSTVGALICYNTKGLELITQAVLFYDCPLLLQGLKTDHDCYTLAKACQQLLAQTAGA